MLVLDDSYGVNYNSDGSIKNIYLKGVNFKLEESQKRLYAVKLDKPVLNGQDRLSIEESMSKDKNDNVTFFNAKTVFSPEWIFDNSNQSIVEVVFDCFVGTYKNITSKLVIGEL